MRWSLISYPKRLAVAHGLALGLAVAFAALAPHVALPHHYASGLGLPLAMVGALLMLVRLIDAGAAPLTPSSTRQRGVP